MPLFSKPQFNSVWATTGNKIAPDGAKILQGWVVEIPPYEFDNWIQNRQDALLAHINQLGIPVWDATVEYQAGKSYIQGVSTGIIYKAVTTNTNINPELDVQGNWVVAFQATGEALQKSQNIADVPNKALDRTNLGIPDTPFYDGRYLSKVDNLADVPNKSSARNNLGLGNSATRNIGTTSGTVMVGDDSRVVNAVQNSRQVYGGGGLVGGGPLSSDQVLAIGTPSPITPTSGNTAAFGTHSHSINMASFFQGGFSGNDWVQLPNGLIIQWGGEIQIWTDKVISFPRPFPNGVFVVNINLGYTYGSGYGGYATASALDRTRFACYSSSSQLGASWIAIGY